MIRARVSPLEEGTQVLSGKAAHYLGRVLRLRPGDHFVAFCDATRTEAVAEVKARSVEADDDAFTLTIEVTALGPAKVVASLPVTLVQGLAKGDKCDQIVRDATELGATHIVFADTERTIVKLKEGRAEERQKRWERIAEEASRQCGRSDPPRIEGPVPWNEALRSMQGARFCLWERATSPFREPLLMALSASEGISFAVGPEGGLTESEVEQAVKEGCTVVSLGPFVLRTETVAAAVLGAIRIFGASPGSEAG